MRVYVNWETQEVYGPKQTEEAIDRKYDEMCVDDAIFEDFLAERYIISQIWEMSDDERAEVLEEFNKLQLEKAEEWFDSKFCEYEVE